MHVSCSEVGEVLAMVGGMFPIDVMTADSTQRRKDLAVARPNDLALREEESTLVEKHMVVGA